MAEVKEIDGKTGELIGASYNQASYVQNTTYSNAPVQVAESSYTGSSSYGYPATYNGKLNATQAQSGQTTQVIQQGRTSTTTTNVVQGGQYSAPFANSYVQNVTGGQVVTGSTHYTQNVGAVAGQLINTAHYGSGAQVVNSTVSTGKDVIKGESRIEYVPFERKITEYKDNAVVDRVQKKRIVTDMVERRVKERIPKEITVTDYYAVEYLRQYIPQYVPETHIETVQVPTKQVRYEYIPVERQIVHYPDSHIESNTAVKSSTVNTGVYGGQQAVYTTGQQVYQTGGSTFHTSQTGPSQVVYTGQTTQVKSSGSRVGAGGYSTGSYVQGPGTYVQGAGTYVQGAGTYTQGTGQSYVVTGGQTGGYVKTSTTGPTSTQYAVSGGQEAFYPSGSQGAYLTSTNQGYLPAGQSYVVSGGQQWTNGEQTTYIQNGQQVDEDGNPY